MIIKKYGDIPATYAPDVGEVVMARKSPAGEFVRAAVLGVRRKRGGILEVKVQWLASSPAVAEGDKPIIKGAVGWVQSGDWPPLIKQINKGQAPDG